MPSDYKLHVEVKTTTSNIKNNFELFRHVKHVEYPDTGARNLAQFEKLASVHNSTNNHFWWYVIVCTQDLTFHNQATLERNFGKSMGMIVQGQAPYSDPTYYSPIMLWDDLMEKARRMLSDLDVPNWSYSQSEMIFPDERDVETVTMNDPLYAKKNQSTPATIPQQVESAHEVQQETIPQQVESAHEVQQTSHEGLTQLITLESEKAEHLVPFLVDVVNKFGIKYFEDRLTPTEKAHYQRFNNVLSDPGLMWAGLTNIRAEFGRHPFLKFTHALRLFATSRAAHFILGAMRALEVDGNVTCGTYNHRLIARFPEFEAIVMRRRDNVMMPIRANIAQIAARQLIKKSIIDRS